MILNVFSEKTTNGLPIRSQQLNEAANWPMSFVTLLQQEKSENLFDPWIEVVFRGYAYLLPPAALPGAKLLKSLTNRFIRVAGRAACNCAAGLPDNPNPFVQIFKIWPPGRATGGII